MFWIFIWVVLSAIVLGATLWSLQILLRQKKAWEAYAKRRGFVFQRGTFMGPAEISGVIDEYKINFFTAERQTMDARGKRYVSVIEVQLAEGLIDGGVAGTKEMQPFMQGLDQLHPYPVKKDGWDESHKIFVRNDAIANAYFTQDRLDLFDQLLKTRNADVLLVFNHEGLVVRLETSDPMLDADKIDKIVARQIALIGKMRITNEERASYMAQGIAV